MFFLFECWIWEGEKMHVIQCDIIKCIIFKKPKIELIRRIPHPHRVNYWPINRPMMKSTMAINSVEFSLINRPNVKLFAELIVILLIIESCLVAGHWETNYKHHHRNYVCNHRHPTAQDVSPWNELKENNKRIQQTLSTEFNHFAHSLSLLRLFVPFEIERAAYFLRHNSCNRGVCVCEVCVVFVNLSHEKWMHIRIEAMERIARKQIWFGQDKH